MGLSYPQLIVAIPAYMRDNSAELAAALDTIIGQAYARLGRAFSDLRQFRLKQSAGLTSQSAVFSIPSDCIYVHTFEVMDAAGTGYVLEQREYDNIKAMYPNPNVNTGLPKFYAEFDAGTYYLGPTPDAPYNYNFIYAKRIQPITAAAPSDWISDNASDALLQASLLEASLFKQDDQLVAKYTSRYQEAVNAVMEEILQTLRDDYRKPGNYNNNAPLPGAGTIQLR